MIIDPTSPALRGHEAVRASVNEKLGAGVGMSLEEACAKLGAVERVEWIMGELIGCMRQKKLHLWVQGWCSGGTPDGPAAVSRIAEAGRRIDPVFADLVRWTADRAVHRPGGLFTVVPEVWNGRWNELVPPFMKSLIARWPADVEPLALPEPPAWSRRVVPPADGAPRYPAVRVGLSEAAADCALQAPPNPDAALEVVAFALWQGGACDEDLDAYYGELGDSGDKLPELFARWISVDGGVADAATLARLRALYHPRHPLETEAGVEKLSWPSLVLLPKDRLKPVAAALEDFPTARIAPTPERPFDDCVRSALRMDPDILLVDARDLAQSGVPMLIKAMMTGHLVAVFGASASVDRLVAEARRGAIPVIRR